MQRRVFDTGVSCNPANLARDGKEIATRGYRLTSIQPVDMFPQTNHIETVACFEKAGDDQL